MELVLARAILSEAKAGGFYDKEMPENESELLNDAEYYMDEAHKAYEIGMKNEAVVSIVALTEDIYKKNGSQVTPEQEERLFDFVKAENLPVPPSFLGSSPEMPRDITTIDDLKVRRLYSEFNAFLNRTKWLLSVEQSDMANAIYLRDEAYRKALKNIDKIDDNGKTKIKDVLDAECKDDKDYQIWDKLAHEHNLRSITLKALSEIYAGNIDRISREMTFRKDEWEKIK
jgi:hypothetical protein